MRSFSQMPNVQRSTLNFQRSIIETAGNPQSAIDSLLSRNSQQKLLEIKRSAEATARQHSLATLLQAKAGADDGIRTRDLRFTKPLLYQLSYVGTRRVKDGIAR
jgi:hypothetical protein